LMGSKLATLKIDSTWSQIQKHLFLDFSGPHPKLSIFRFLLPLR
jgi:hypothetical protein